MSNAMRNAALEILPKVWATVESTSETASPTERKGPHRLCLVGGYEADATLAYNRAAAEPGSLAPLAFTPPATRPQPVPQLAFYRKYTEAMLARYMSMSLEAGRVPSLMGREMFHGRVSHTRVSGFDDVIHFVHDMDGCFKQMSPGLVYLLRRIAMQGYTQGDAAAMLGISLSTTIRRYNEALDRLTGLLIDRGMLQLAYASEPAEEQR